MPKLLTPSKWNHKIIGIFSKSSNDMIAFVDISLQPSSGTMEALDPVPWSKRRQIKGLKPYICNFLTAPKYRKRGFAKMLITECEKYAYSIGYDEIYLHCKIDTPPALTLYISSGFEPQQRIGNDTVFMRKKISPYRLKS